LSRSRVLKTTGATKKEKKIMLPIQQTRLSIYIKFINVEIILISNLLYECS
jgi:hypothetical protein